MRCLPVALGGALLLIAGCSRKGHDGALPPVQAQVVTEYGPAAGAHVLVSGIDGVLELVETDDQGEAQVVVDGGENVTAYFEFTTEFGLTLVSLYTVANVQPGDSLVIPVDGPAPAGTRGEVSFTLGGPGYVGATSYRVVVGGCPGAEATTGSSGTFEVTIDARCSGGSDVYFPYLYAASAGIPIAFQVLADPVPMEELLAGGAAFAGPWRTEFEAIDFSLSLFPATTYGYRFDFSAVDRDGHTLATSSVAGNAVSGTTVTGALELIPLSDLSTMYPHQRIIAAALSTNGTTTVDGSDFAQFAYWDVEIPGLLARFAGNYLESVEVAADPSGLALSWTGVDEFTLPITSRIDLETSYAVGRNRALTWRARAPGKYSTFRFPAWPELAADAPPTDAGQVDSANVRFVFDSEFGSGWDDARVADDRRLSWPHLRVTVERGLD